MIQIGQLDAPTKICHLEGLIQQSSVGTLFNMEAAGLRVRWKVRAGCGFFSSNSTTQVVFPVV